MTIHVRTWIGARNGRITDMANAGKRGKRCRILRIMGATSNHDAEANHHTLRLMAYVSGLAGLDLSQPVNHVVELDFDAVTAPVRAMVAEAHAAGVSDWLINAYDEDIRSVDAPRPLLSHSGNGWSASADEDGITLLDEADQYNLPAMITAHGQSHNKAYDIARKAWAEVTEAKSFHDAGDVLRKHGAKLHYYCRMD